MNIELIVKKETASVLLNRPKVRNALNKEMMSQLIEILVYLRKQQEIRFVILEGRGNIFCSGADLKWMQQAAGMSLEDNFDESLLLAKCIHHIYKTEKITIAKVHGGAYGGAIGMMAACDFACCTANTSFALSEVKLGLIPAVIAPYVLRRVGISNAKELMLTARKFNGTDAEKYGLVNKCLKNEEELSVHIHNLIAELRHTAPKAQQQLKSLLNNLLFSEINDTTINHTAEIIANARLTGEAKEGVSAFLQKRTPRWSE